MSVVLVVEDNENNMELVSFILENAGFEVLKAKRGMEGVEMAHEHKPDFILLDIQLPDIDGLEVLRRLRTSDDCKSIPVIAVTSYAMSGDRESLLNAGCNGYIEKPINPERVIEQINTILIKTGKGANAQ